MSRTTTTARRRNAQRGCQLPLPPPPPIRPVRERPRTFLSCAPDPLPHARECVLDSLKRHHHRLHRRCKVIQH
jgi:hypothetical protein